MRDKLFSSLCLGLALAELLVIVGSWVLSVLFPDCEIRSMLGSDGIRWFFGSFTSMLSGDVLVWILLLSMAWRSVKESRLFACDRQYNFNERIALSCVVVATLLYICAVVVLAALPHAVLLSVSGSLVESPFSRSLIPIIAFGVIFCSTVYGVMSGRYDKFRCIFVPLSKGVASSAWLIVIYVFAAQLFYSLSYVFGFFDISSLISDFASI